MAVPVILISIGVCLAVWGAVDLSDVSDRTAAVGVFNEEVVAWQKTHRPLFSALDIKAQLTVDGFSQRQSLVATTAGSVGAIDAGLFPGVKPYSPLQYLTADAFVVPSDLAQWHQANGPAGHISSVSVNFTIRAADGRSWSVPAAVDKMMNLYTEQTTTGNTKVCRNDGGVERGGHCLVRQVVTEMCFVVRQAAGEWELDHRHGCYLHGTSNWEFQQVRRISSSQLAHRPVSFKIGLVDDQDPWILTAGTAGEEAELESDPETTGWVLIVLGAILMLAGAAQVIFAKQTAAKAEDLGAGICAGGQQLEERGSYPQTQY